jgi:hypothetical protein
VIVLKLKKCIAMIDIIGFSLNAQTGNLYVAWDYYNVTQTDWEPTPVQLLNLLMFAEYIIDYRADDRDNTIDVAILVGNQKYWLEFERWLSDKVSDELCERLLQQIICV